jgi:hypothetical protein
MNTKLMIRYGLLTGASLIVYFLLMQILGLIEITELRYLNLLILMGGLFLFLKKFCVDKFSYLNAFTSGIYVSAIAVFSFVIFFMFYIDFLDPNFYEYIRENEDFGSYLNKGALAFMLVAEGLSSGLIVTFICMQYFKSFLYKN